MADPPPSAPSPSPSDAHASDFDRLGGEAGLRPLIAQFVQRIVSDMMIGFFFRHVDPVRLEQLEYEFAAAHLGGPVAYTGRPLEAAHSAHPILGGQFNRRLKILEKLLTEAHVPEDIQARWLAHNERLRPLITRDKSHECDPTRAAEHAAAARAKRERSE